MSGATDSLVRSRQLTARGRRNGWKKTTVVAETRSMGVRGVVGRRLDKHMEEDELGDVLDKMRYLSSPELWLVVLAKM